MSEGMNGPVVTNFLSYTNTTYQCHGQHVLPGALLVLEYALSHHDFASQPGKREVTGREDHGKVEALGYDILIT